MKLERHINVKFTLRLFIMDQLRMKTWVKLLKKENQSHKPYKRKKILINR